MRRRLDPARGAIPPELPAGRYDFSQLDQRTIAVRLLAASGYQWLKGVGTYESDPELGGVLRIAIKDDVSPYELFFIQKQWNGAILPGAAVGCDYMLSIG